MTRELTPDIKAWLEVDADDQTHILKGAELYLRITRNRIFYNNVVRAPSKFHSRLRYELGKIYEQRRKSELIDITRKEVRQLIDEVERIDRRENLSDRHVAEIRRGKRPDHDSLPDEIKQLYIDNDQIRLKMREAHLRLRMITESNSSCPDSDRYPWAKEIKRLDKLYRDNWYRYDTYGQRPVDDPAAQSRQAVRLLNLNKRRLSDTRDPELLEKMRQWWRLVISPTAKLAQEMKILGVDATE